MAQARSSSNRTASRGGDGIIGPGARVRGRVTGDGGLMVAGHIEGSVAVRGDLTVASTGSIVSKEPIEAHAVTLEGHVDGHVQATGQVRVAAGSRVRGDLSGAAIAIDDGAEFAGRIDCEFELPPELGGTKRR